MIAIALGQSAVYANPNQALAAASAVIVQFDQTDPTMAICQGQAPFQATFIVSQNRGAHLGFADLLIDGSLIQSQSYKPQIVLANEGMSDGFDLLGTGGWAGPNYDISLHNGAQTLYLYDVFLDNVSPYTGNNGLAEMVFSQQIAHDENNTTCAIVGHIIKSIPLSSAS